MEKEGRNTQVAEQCTALEIACTALHESISALEERLRSILQRGESAASSIGIEEEPESLVPHAEFLRDRVVAIMANTRYLDGLRRRLEL